MVKDESISYISDIVSGLNSIENSPKPGIEPPKSMIPKIISNGESGSAYKTF